MAEATAIIDAFIHVLDSESELAAFFLGLLGLRTIRVLWGLVQNRLPTGTGSE